MVICINEPLPLINVNNGAEYVDITGQFSHDYSNQNYAEEAFRCTSDDGVNYRCLVRPCANKNGTTFETAFVCMVTSAKDSCEVFERTTLNKRAVAFLFSLLGQILSDNSEARSNKFSEEGMKELNPLVQFAGDRRKEIQIILVLPAAEFQTFEDEALWFPAELEYVILCQSEGEKIAQLTEEKKQLADALQSAKGELQPANERIAQLEGELQSAKSEHQLANEKIAQLEGELRAANEEREQLKDLLRALTERLERVKALLRTLSPESVKELAEQYSPWKEYITPHGKDFDWIKEDDHKIQLQQAIVHFLEAAISGNYEAEPQVVQKTKVETAEVDRGTEINKAEQVSPNRESERKTDDKEERISGGAVNPPILVMNWRGDELLWQL